MLNMSKILGNIYDRSIVIVFGTVVFSSFWSLWNHFFWQKKFQNIIFLFSFSPKNSKTGSRKTSITQELLAVESCPTPSWVTFLIFCRLVYDVYSHLNDLILARSTSFQPLNGQRPKSKASVWNSSISETDSKSNLTCW